MNDSLYGAKYTISLHELLSGGFPLEFGKYPIWDEKHREELETKIVNHYRFYEIGFETPGRFMFELQTKMNEIMPYYVKLYETTQFDYNPIFNADYTDEYTITRNKEENGNSNSSGTSTTNQNNTVNSNTHDNSTSNSDGTQTTNDKNIDSNTPQGVLNINDIDSIDYASNVGFNKNEQSNSNNITSETDTSNDTTSSGSSETSGSNETITKNTGNETETYKKKLSGNYGVKSTQAMIQEERALILNIDLQIIEELRDLFMMIY